MVATDGQTPDSLIETFRREPYTFDFFAAVRLLQSRAAEMPRIGHSLWPAQDPVRFAQNPSTNFAPTTIEEFSRRAESRAPVLYSRHFGLFGPNGPLPLCLTEFALERMLHHRDDTFAEFCNVFHHRLTSFFFRAWADTQKTVDFDRPNDENWTNYIGALIGLGMDSLRDRDSVPDQAKLYFAGRLSAGSRNAEGLEAIVREFFGVPTELHTFVGRWMDLPPDSLCKLGASPSTGKLGSTAIAGSRIWSCQLHFRLRFGPLTWAEFERLLPTGPSFKRLRDWVRLYVGDQYSWDVQLVVSGREIPKVQLPKAGQQAKAPQLGWNTWVTTKPFVSDAVISFPGVA